MYVVLPVCRAAQKEIAALSQMAEQIKPRLQETTSEAVDLDNLFAFLSDVQPNHGRNQIIDEIGEKMNELVEDLDIELETVIQQELEGLAQEQVVNIFICSNSIVMSVRAFSLFGNI